MSDSAPPPFAPTPLLPATASDTYTPHQEDRTMGMLTHLVAVLAGPLGAVIMFFCMKGKSPFLDHHTRESLNFQLTLFLINLALILLGVLLAIVAGRLALLVLPFFLILYIGSLILEIMACVAANKGQWHRYPFAFRLLS